MKKNRIICWRHILLIRNAFESAGVTDAWDDDKLDQNVDNDMENGLSGILAETSNQSDSQQ